MRAPGPIRIPVCAAMALVLELFCYAAQQTQKQAFAVWDGTCLVDVIRTPETRMEAPFENGQPNLKKMKVLHLTAKYQANCYRIEVR